MTLNGTLTLHGAAAPASTTVKIYRRVPGSTVNSATLTATTTAGGAFTATDLPPGRGATTTSPATRAPASTSTRLDNVPVHVTAIKPTLKLAVSAKSVKAGRKVTITATLGAGTATGCWLSTRSPRAARKQ